MDNNAINALPPIEKRVKTNKLRYEAYDPPKPTPKLRESMLKRALSPTRKSLGVLLQEEYPMTNFRKSGESARSRSRESHGRKSPQVQGIAEDHIELSPLNLSTRTVS